MDKLNQLFKRLISEMILMREVNDPRINFVTITYANISKDLSVAHIGFSVLSDDAAMIMNAQAGLDSARGRVRKLIGERVSLRKTPEIKFVFDNTIAESVRMSKALEEIKRERESREGKEAGDQEGA